MRLCAKRASHPISTGRPGAISGPNGNCSLEIRERLLQLIF
jgi:hypothetical protein